MAPPGDPYYRNINLFTSDSEWIKYHTIVSTSSDRIAVAPGYLKREWNQNGRKFFEYDMGDYAYQQLLFLYLRTVRREARSLEKRAARDYYQPGHEYNLDRMLEASKRGLEYLERNFAPISSGSFVYWSTHAAGSSPSRSLTRCRIRRLSASLRTAVSRPIWTRSPT